MAWIWLILAGLFEVGFTTCLKLSDNFRIWYWAWGFGICTAASFYMLNKATQFIPMGTAYAVWTGIGAAGTVLVGITFFKESADLWRLFFLVLLIGSVLGLKFVAAH